MKTSAKLSSENSSALRYGTFATIFSASFSLSYLIADVYKLPIFSYYPATMKVTLGWTPSTVDDGPAMYWYGWLLTSLVIALPLSLLCSTLPFSVLKKIPTSLAWIVPVTLIPVLIYTLKFYWR